MPASLTPQERCDSPPCCRKRDGPAFSFELPGAAIYTEHAADSPVRGSSRFDGAEETCDHATFSLQWWKFGQRNENTH
jgi:hypothetical protein